MLKAAFFSAALLAASPATADVWTDEACDHVVVVDNGAFIDLGDTTYRICVIAHWPINRPYADMACTGNTTVTMTPHGKRAMEFDGVMLTKRDEPLPCE